MTGATCSYKSGTGAWDGSPVAVNGQGGEEAMVGKPRTPTPTPWLAVPAAVSRHLSLSRPARQVEIIYTLSGPGNLPPDQRDRTKDMMHQNFSMALDNMKKVAEAKIIRHCRRGAR